MALFVNDEPNTTMALAINNIADEILGVIFSKLPPKVRYDARLLAHILLTPGLLHLYEACARARGF